MKKLIALLLALVMVIGLVACGNTPAETPEEPETTAGTEAQPEVPEEDTPAVRSETCIERHSETDVCS